MYDDASERRASRATAVIIVVAVILLVLSVGGASGFAYLFVVGGLVGRPRDDRSGFLARSGGAVAFAALSSAADVTASANWGGDFWWDISPGPWTAFALVLQLAVLWFLWRRTTPRPSPWLYVWMAVILTMVAFELGGHAHGQSAEILVPLAVALLTLAWISSSLVLVRGEKDTGATTMFFSALLTLQIWANVGSGSAYFGFWEARVH